MANLPTAAAPTITDEDRLAAAARWLEANADKAGSPEFVQVAEGYRQLRAPQLQAERVAKEKETDTWGNVALRAGTNVLTSIPDLVGGLVNYGPGRLATNWLAGRDAQPAVPSAGVTLREATGIPEVPSYAGPGRQFMENALPALATAGPVAGVQALRVGSAVLPAVGRSIMPALTATGGSMAGGAIGEQVGGEGGAFWGSVLGGGAPALRGRVDPRTQADPNAPAIAAAARSFGIEPTPGMVGDTLVKAQERKLAALPGSDRMIFDRREDVRTGMNAAAADIIEQRQALPPQTPANAPVIQLAEQTPLPMRSDVLQESLQQRVGDTTPVDTAGIIGALVRSNQRTDPTTAAPLQVRARALNTMIRDPQSGNMPPGPITRATQPIGTDVPYERVKSWRSNLGAYGQNVDAVPGHLRTPVYDAATDAMRQTAMRQGVSPEQFDTTQQISRSHYAARDLQTLADILAENKAASARRFSEAWRGDTPQERARMGGPQEPRMDALSTVARAYDYPTSGAGLTTALGGQMQSSIGRMIRAGIGQGAGFFLGGPVGQFVGGVAAEAANSPINRLKAWSLLRRAREMEQGPLPQGRMAPGDMARLMAILQAAGIGAQR